MYLLYYLNVNRTINQLHFIVDIKSNFISSNNSFEGHNYDVC